MNDVLVRMFRDLLAADQARQQLLVEAALYALEAVDQAALEGQPAATPARGAPSVRLRTRPQHPC